MRLRRALVLLISMDALSVITIDSAGESLQARGGRAY